MMRILITGGAGFIGSHLVDYLIGRGLVVIIVDNLSTGKLENIEHHLSNPQFEMHIGDILTYPELEELCQNSDMIFHLASSVGISYIYSNPLKSLESNIEGNIKVLKAAAAYKKPVVFFSSSEIYGKNSSNLLDEQGDRLLGPSFRWSYSVGKAIGEYYAQALSKELGLQYLIIRCFNIVGPRQTGQYGMVLPRFVAQARDNKPMTVYGTGNQIRTFTSVYDVVEILWELVFELHDFGQTYNIGSQNSISIAELAEMVKVHLDSHSEIRNIPVSSVYGHEFEDVDVRIPSISRLLHRMPYHQFRSLEQIIDSIIDKNG